MSGAGDDTIRGYIDAPAAGDAVPQGMLTVTGWTFAQDGPLERVLLVAGSGTGVPVRLGVWRPEVGEYFPAVVHAGASGFETPLICGPRRRGPCGSPCSRHAPGEPLQEVARDNGDGGGASSPARRRPAARSVHDRAERAGDAAALAALLRALLRAGRSVRARPRHHATASTDGSRRALPRRARSIARRRSTTAGCARPSSPSRRSCCARTTPCCSPRSTSSSSPTRAGYPGSTRTSTRWRRPAARCTGFNVVHQPDEPPLRFDEPLLASGATGMRRSSTPSACSRGSRCSGRRGSTSEYDAPDEPPDPELLLSTCTASTTTRAWSATAARPRATGARRTSPAARARRTGSPSRTSSTSGSARARPRRAARADPRSHPGGAVNALVVPTNSAERLARVPRRPGRRGRGTGSSSSRTSRRSTLAHPRGARTRRRRAARGVSWAEIDALLPDPSIISRAGQRDPLVRLLARLDDRRGDHLHARRRLLPGRRRPRRGASRQPVPHARVAELGARACACAACPYRNTGMLHDVHVSMGLWRGLPGPRRRHDARRRDAARGVRRARADARDAVGAVLPAVRDERRVPPRGRVPHVLPADGPRPAVPALRRHLGRARRSSGSAVTCGYSIICGGRSSTIAAHRTRS